jgi:hypothetical protein
MISRIGRGLFRLWLVVSIAWIGLMVLVNWSSLQRPYSWDPPWLIEIFERELPERIQQMVEVALVPPLLFLMLGSAFYWALRGFRA